MKLAIVSDLHIGYERFEEDAYKQACEALIAAAEEADAILVPGDVFDKRSPKPDVIAQAINIFRDISKKKWRARITQFNSSAGSKSYTDIPVIAIPGTHERVAEGKDNVLKLLALAGLIVDASESQVVIELDGEKVAVFGLGGVSEERVREVLQRLDPKPMDGAFNVFMMHQSVYELLPFGEDIIKYADLPKGFDLYINGHIHNRIEAMVHGKKFLIPGSTVLTQLKDGEQDPKGLILFDTKKYTHEFRPINSRKFIVIDIKIDDASPKLVTKHCEDEIEKVIARHKDRPIIRIKLQGSIASGFTSIDMPLRSIVSKYSQKAIVEIDSSKLKSATGGDGIKGLQEGETWGMTIKELGMTTFVSKLKDGKLDSGFDARRLFEILSSDQNREKTLKSALEMLEEFGEKGSG
jgi:DNA repair exonuclease SbcCD nuclease subunit